MEVRLGYKQTEVGIIPVDWEVSKLGDLIDYTKGFPFKSSEYRSTGTRVVRVSDTTYDSIKNEDPIFVSEKRLSQYSNWKLKEHDLVLSTVGSKPPMYDSMVGKVILIGKPHENSLLNQNAVLMRDKKHRAHVQRLLLNHLRTKRYLTHIGSIYRGNANQASITLQELFQFCIPLPSDESEQRAIAEALSNMDALLGALDRIIAKKRDLKQAAMQQLITGQTRLPGFHGEWEVKALGDLFTFSGGYSAARDQLSTEGHCYLHYGDIHGSTKTSVDARADYQDIPKLDIPLKRVSSSSLLKDGDVVFVGSSEDDEGTSRHVVVVNKDDVPFISGMGTIVAKSKTDELAHEYRQYCFQTAAMRQQFLFYAVGTKVSGIRKTDIPKLTLPVPSVPEQTAIAAFLTDMDAELALLEQQLAKTRALKQGMMQELLTGRSRLVVAEVAA